MKNQPGFFDFAAEVGLTKHIGGLEATELHQKSWPGLRRTWGQPCNHCLGKPGQGYWSPLG
jgi:hypothetical protein